MTSPDVLRQHVLPRLHRIRGVGGGQFKASCPVPSHGKGRGDRNPSLSVGPGDTQPVVFRCQANCTQDDVKAALIGLGIDWALISEPRTGQSSGAGTADTWMPCQWDRKRIRPDHSHVKVAEYLYRDAGGTVQYGTARCALKGNGCPGFAYWRPDPGSRSGRRWSLTDQLPDGSRRRAVPHLPYRLPEALHAIEQGQAVWVVEGEKDADRLAAIGVAAVCNDGGAGKWNAEYANHLVGADIIIVADRDRPGWAHAETVAETLLPLARSIEVIRALEGKDTSAHLDAGLRIGQFVHLAEPLPPPDKVPGCVECEAATL